MPASPARLPSSARRLPVVLAAAFALAFVGGARAQEEARGPGPVSVQRIGLVVHGVDTDLLKARFRQVDRKLVEREDAGVARDLAELLQGDLSPLIEESAQKNHSVYLAAREAALLRVATLPDGVLSAYRALVDPLAEGALEDALETLDAGSLADEAYPLALSTHGPRLFLTLADLRLARGDTSGATRVLEDLLRYWPDEGRTAQLPGVDRAAVVSRLAALLAAQGDVAGVRRLREITAPGRLDAASPALPDTTLRAEIARAEAAAQRREEEATIPRGARLEPVAEIQWLVRNRASPISARLGLTQPVPPFGREIVEHPVAVTGPDGPLLITRQGRPLAGSRAVGRTTSLVALGPPPAGAPAARGDLPPDLVVHWSWPSRERIRAGMRGGGLEPFRPSVHGDLLLFPWPSERLPAADLGVMRGDSTVLNDLIVLSVRAEGAEVDIRGTGESLRDDADPGLESLSFCGKPLIVGRSVYCTLVGYAKGGQNTELHVARFDLEQRGPSWRLRRRWRRHVVDGTPPARAKFSEDEEASELRPLVLPAGLAERAGRVYVCSNTGAVACLDARTGDVEWLETYARLGTDRMTIRETRRAALRASERHDIVTWKDSIVHVDGQWLYATPRDSEQFLVYHHRPLRADRSALVEMLDVRGGSTLWSLRPDDVVTVRDGVAYFSGHVAAPRPGSLRTPSSALVAYRVRERREGEPVRPDALAQTPEPAASGAPAVQGGAILFPSYKGIYRVPLHDVGAELDLLYAPSIPKNQDWLPDRIGNLVVDGPRVWSVTPSRVVLFEAR